MSSGRNPRTGDWVTARLASGRGERVEGLLDVRHVPALDYVQVEVLLPSGALRSVDPDTVVVLEEQRVPTERVQADDPLRGDEGWRPVASVTEARAAGLETQPRRRPPDGGARGHGRSPIHRS